MSSPRVTILVLAFFGQVLSPAAEVCLQDPRNLTLVSEDFKLFLRWQPADNYPPEVFYSVKWWSSYTGWNTTSCVNISATSCDITCVNQRLNNRFRVQVEALERTGCSSRSVNFSDYIDYNLLVELAPPVLQVREVEKLLVVNTTFTIPSCVKDLFQDLSYELEFWEQGTKLMKFSDLTENVFSINTTLFSSDSYCVQAKASLPLRRKLSNFSKPVCGLLHKGEENWRLLFFLLLLLLLVLPAGVAYIYFFWYKPLAAKFKMPQVLYFSNYKCPKRFLKFDEIKVDAVICERVAEIRRRPAPQVNPPLIPSEFPAAAEEEKEEDNDDDDDDDDEDDESGCPIPYTEFRFPQKDTSCEGVGMDQDVLDSPSESDHSLSHGECTELVIGKSTFDLQDSNRTSLPGNSSSNESLDFPLSCPATRGWEETNGKMNFHILLSTLRVGCDLSLPTETPFVATIDFPEGNWEDVEDMQMPLLRRQGHKDSRGILLEEQAEEDTGFESTSSGCGRLSTASSLETIESCTPVGNRDSIPRPTFHGYQPREHISYISRVGLTSSSKS